MKKKSFLVTTILNCNTTEEIKHKIFSNYEEAKKYFDSEVEELIGSYMDDEDNIKDWLSKPGIITKEYNGTVEDNHISFDCNSVLLEELQGR